MRNREKKVKPIACHVIPWRSLGSGVGRMFRHQYLLVKQKIKRPEFSGSEGGGDCDDVSELLIGLIFLGIIRICLGMLHLLLVVMVGMN
ncbi:hypothetical protein JHK82_042054 [Glycine max]|uniref:Transmembrane protein n=1 Tax=Glycine max TaxID=3847 RepID=A0A0R0FZG8_SOYBN|nr:hypothetical protein JHK86_042106 [Glycine max]KAG4956348.1 hypothetical protein JHK85_042728 [Glycine max]KAG5105084.1 hypothetical protein JHK82_042054 [Glycine max]KAG5116209.1 hypothetical protein JHK84_042322 [Glycine max]KAH1146720.1 hypothetical protein GYH30_042080 [Glycine max]